MWDSACGSYGIGFTQLEMTKRNKSSSKKGTRKQNKRGGANGAHIPGQKQFYNGPLRLPHKLDNKDLIEIEMSQDQAVSSSGAGVINLVIANNQAAFLDATSLTALWDEWRCLSMEAEYIPNVWGSQYSGTATTCIYGVVDNDNATALTAYSSAADYASVIGFSPSQPVKFVWKMSGSEDAQFINNTATATGWFKYYATGEAASTNYGRFIVKAIFQYRGRI
jgi:hypothetical protein